MRLILLILIVLLSLNVHSQKGVGLVIGNLMDSSGQAIGEATVSLTRVDTTLGNRSMITDKNGFFEFGAIQFGIYRIRFSSIGFAELVIDSIHIRQERYDFNLGDIRLQPKGVELETVIIYAEKPLIESKDGKITYNVGESALSTGASTSELLKNMPLISNDANGKILLKGKEPRILIDDKPTELNAQQLADLLESMPGSSIEKIELMTNPPPQYASESGGVINIVTKKGKIGFTGRVNASYGIRGEGSLSVNMSYRNRKFTMNLTAGAGASRLTGDGSSFRQNFYADSTNSFQTANEYVNKNLRPNMRLTADYEFNKRNQLNITTQLNANYFDNNSLTEYKNFNRFDELYKWSTRSNETDGKNFNPSASITYTHKGKDAREVMRFIASINGGLYENERMFFQEFYNPDKTPTGVDSTQRQITDNTSNNWNLRFSYDKPLRKNITLSTGFTSGRGNYHNKLNTEFFSDPANEFVKNPLLSNDFRFYQTIHTVRGSVTFDLGRKWRLITGLQVENTRFNFTFKTLDDDYANDYYNWLPNFNLRKEWKSGWNTAVVYRRSIRRPGINELNPSVDYNDPYNLRFGNPTLQPQLAENFDWNLGLYKGKSNVNFSAGYNYVKDIIQSIRTLGSDGKTVVTYQNITHRREYEASVWGGYAFSKKFRMNASAGYTFNQYSEYDKSVNKYRDGGTFYTNVNYNFIMNDRVSLDGNIRFNSIADAQGRSRSNVKQNIGLQTKWLNKQLVVSFNLIDFLSQQQFNTVTYGKNFELESVSSSRTRNFRVGVSYNLRSTAKPAKK